MLLCFVTLVAFISLTLVEAADAVISPAQPDPAGWIVHEVRSEYQSAITQIRIILPEAPQLEERFPVIYVLPVEAGRESRYGDGLAEINLQNLNTRHRVIFVAPTFSQLPWYADHPTDPLIRQESYFLNVVLPFIEREYPAQATLSARLLLGFSKSGWGAWSLILRHPETFGAAAAWDAPLMMDWPSKYGSQPIFGTQENFTLYHIRSLLESCPESLKSQPRLILTGYGGNGTGGFRQEHLDAHGLMERLGISHHFRDGPACKHEWHSGWVAEAVELLLQTSRTIN